MTIRPEKHSRLMATLLLAVLPFSLLWVSAQPQIGGRGRNVRIPGYDSQNRLSSQLLAKEAIPKGETLIEIEGLKAETYAYQGKTMVTNLIVTATNCLYDKKLEVATSERPVEAVTGDGRIKLSGVGFRYERVDSKIVISNQVRIEINRELLTKKEGK